MMKVSELEGAALGLWVARALGYEQISDLAQIGLAAAGMRSPVIFINDSGALGVAGEDLRGRWAPHEDWAQGGPIIEREGISIVNADSLRGKWQAGIVIWLPDHDEWEYGETALVAAMRCFVASKFGNEVLDA